MEEAIKALMNGDPAGPIGLLIVWFIIVGGVSALCWIITASFNLYASMHSWRDEEERRRFLKGDE